MKTIQAAFINQFNVFASAIRSRSGTDIIGTFEEGFKTTSCVNYADLAFLSKGTVRFDPASMDISDNETAQSMIKREYREGYDHPYVG